MKETMNRFDHNRISCLYKKGKQKEKYHYDYSGLSVYSYLYMWVCRITIRQIHKEQTNENEKLKRISDRNSLGIQWLGSCAFTAKDLGLIPDWGN